MIDCTSVDKYHKIGYFILCALAFSMCISTALTNVFLTLSVCFFLFLLYKKDINLTSINNNKLALLILIFWGVLLISSLMGKNVFFSLKETWQVYIFRMLPFFLALGMTKSFSIKEREKIVFYAYISLTLTSIVAIYQFIHGNTRPYGLSSHYMHLAGYYCVLLPIFFLQLLDECSLKWIKQRCYSYVMFAICLVGLVLNNTRGAWIAVGISSIIVLIVMAFRNWRKMLIGVLLMCVVCGFVATNDFFSARAKSVSSIAENPIGYERLLIWESAFNMIHDHPLLGVAPGGFTDLYQLKYISPKAKEPNLRHCHNLFLQVWTENGFLGIVSFMAMIVYTLYTGFNYYKKDKNVFGFMIALIVLSMMIQGLTEFNATVFKLTWLIIGLLYMECKNELNANHTSL